jgi:hypothetical protein
MKEQDMMNQKAKGRGTGWQWIRSMNFQIPLLDAGKAHSYINYKAGVYISVYVHYLSFVT